MVLSPVKNKKLIDKYFSKSATLQTLLAFPSEYSELLFMKKIITDYFKNLIFLIMTSRLKTLKNKGVQFSKMAVVKK
jgi:hypothetical protein